MNAGISFRHSPAAQPGSAAGRVPRPSSRSLVLLCSFDLLRCTAKPSGCPRHTPGEGSLTDRCLTNLRTQYCSEDSPARRGGCFEPLRKSLQLLTRTLCLAAMSALAIHAPAQAGAAKSPVNAGPPSTGRLTGSALRQEAERWYASGHRSPDKRPAAWHVFRALQQAGRVAATSAAAHAQSIATSGGSWQLAGPLPLNTSGSISAGLPTQDYGNISGRIGALALDPSDPTGNTVWVGAANGGVWKCTHALSSATCTPKTDAQASLSTGAIAINPSNGTIYVGTGEGISGAVDQVYGQGILTSADGGASWKLITSADGGAENLFGLAFSRILIDPTNPQVIVAATEGAWAVLVGAHRPACRDRPSTGRGSIGPRMADPAGPWRFRLPRVESARTQRIWPMTRPAAATTPPSRATACGSRPTRGRPGAPCHRPSPVVRA